MKEDRVFIYADLEPQLLEGDFHYHCYAAPHILCHNCQALIALPYPDLPK